MSRFNEVHSLTSRKLRLVWCQDLVHVLSFPKTYSDMRCDQITEEFLQDLLSNIDSGYNPLTEKEADAEISMGASVVEY